MVVLSDLSGATAGISPAVILPCPLLAAPRLSWLGHICLLDIGPKKWGSLRPAVIRARREVVS